MTISRVTSRSLTRVGEADCFSMSFPSIIIPRKPERRTAITYSVEHLSQMTSGIEVSRTLAPSLGQRALFRAQSKPSRGFAKYPTRGRHPRFLNLFQVLAVFCNLHAKLQPSLPLGISKVDQSLLPYSGLTGILFDDEMLRLDTDSELLPWFERKSAVLDKRLFQVHGVPRTDFQDLSRSMVHQRTDCSAVLVT